MEVRIEDSFFQPVGVTSASKVFPGEGRAAERGIFEGDHPRGEAASGKLCTAPGSSWGCLECAEFLSFHTEMVAWACHVFLQHLQQGERGSRELAG